MDYDAYAKEIWLNYFNDTLYGEGIISKSEYSKMAQLIRKKCHAFNRSGRNKSPGEN